MHREHLREESVVVVVLPPGTRAVVQIFSSSSNPLGRHLEHPAVKVHGMTLNWPITSQKAIKKPPF